MTDRDASCRLILRTWRDNPAFDFPPPYTAFGPALATLASDANAARLIDGVVVRIGRGDSPDAIRRWADRFANRRGLVLPPQLRPL